MGLIAIAANPASGRDIRRFVSYATVFSNREKASIIERVIITAAQLGKHRFCIMPDSSFFGRQVIDRLEEDLKCVQKGTVYVPDIPIMDKQEDTTYFAQYAQKHGAGVLVVLGGDGTSRAAAKGICEMPLIALSTGTNNVFPDMAEGTVVGIAAAALADGTLKPEDCCRRSKCIEVYKNGAPIDIALIDAVFSSQLFSGAKAVWQRDDIKRIVVTQCHPATIGFSAVLGGTVIVSPDEDVGAIAECSADVPNVRGSLSAGVIMDFCLKNVRKLPLGEKMIFTMDYSGMLALDGEREVRWNEGDTIELIITRKGPLKVDLRQALELALEKGYFKL